MYTSKYLSLAAVGLMLTMAACGDQSAVESAALGSSLQTPISQAAPADGNVPGEYVSGCECESYLTESGSYVCAESTASRKAARNGLGMISIPTGTPLVEEAPEGEYIKETSECLCEFVEENDGLYVCADNSTSRKAARNGLAMIIITAGNNDTPTAGQTPTVVEGNQVCCSYNTDGSLNCQSLPTRQVTTDAAGQSTVNAICPDNTRLLECDGDVVQQRDGSYVCVEDAQTVGGLLLPAIQHADDVASPNSGGGNSYPNDDCYLICEDDANGNISCYCEGT